MFVLHHIYTIYIHRVINGTCGVCISIFMYTHVYTQIRTQLCDIDIDTAYVIYYIINIYYKYI